MYIYHILIQEGIIAHECIKMKCIAHTTYTHDTMLGRRSTLTHTHRNSNNKGIKTYTYFGITSMHSSICTHMYSIASYLSHRRRLYRRPLCHGLSAGCAAGASVCTWVEGSTVIVIYRTYNI